MTSDDPRRGWGSTGETSVKTWGVGHSSCHRFACCIHKSTRVYSTWVPCCIDEWSVLLNQLPVLHISYRLCHGNNNGSHSWRKSSKDFSCSQDARAGVNRLIPRWYVLLIRRTPGERWGSSPCTTWQRWTTKQQQQQHGRWKLPEAANWRPSIHKRQVGSPIWAWMNRKCYRNPLWQGGSISAGGSFGKGGNQRWEALTERKPWFQ